MKRVKHIVFRYLTDADFFNMYKPPGTEPSGGGQKYIDFRTTKVTVAQWSEFFSNVTNVQKQMRENGPRWTFPIYSIGLVSDQLRQTLTIYQRRAASICIASQHIHVQRAKRVLAWHPDHGFPEPKDPGNRHQLPKGLVVYLVRTYENDVWAGWFINAEPLEAPFRNAAAKGLLEPMVDSTNPAGAAGFLTFDDGELLLDENDPHSPFETQRPKIKELKPVSGVSPDQKRLTAARQPRSGLIRQAYKRRQRTEDEIVESLFGEDEEYEGEVQEKKKEITIRVRQRNSRAIKDLKELYQHECQVTGKTYIFKKKDGIYYTEAHHLIPIGSGGADNPRNVIIVSPLVHRMLHYADVSGIDLSKIKERKDGSARLEILINGETYAISWHPKHAQKVLQYEQK